MVYNRTCVKAEDLIVFRNWFSDYCRAYYSSDAEDQKNISLKEEHTLRVCENIAEIARRLSLGENEALLAGAAALFHDIGRFPQYAQYKTFRDGISVNHGLLGAETLRERKVLRSLPPDEQEIVLRAVKFHNAFSVPQEERRETVFFTRLVRDADKLDIWRVFLEYYEGREASRASAVGLGLSGERGCSAAVISRIYEKKIVSLSAVRTLDDFKLLQLSWIFDLNFRPSYDLLAERRYIRRIAGHLPETGETRKLASFLEECAEEKRTDSGQRRTGGQNIPGKMKEGG